MADTKQPELSMERFEALVGAYGCDFERFPVRERTAAKALVLRSPEARRVLEAARAFDELLATARDQSDTRGLELTLAEIPKRHAQIRVGIALLPFRSRTRAALAAAAAVALGLFTGQLAPSDATDAGDELESASASLTFADELFEDLATVEGGAD